MSERDQPCGDKASDTPRTDAHCKEIGGDDGLCYAEFASQLERELSEDCEDCDHGIRGGSPCQSCGGCGRVLIADLLKATQRHVKELVASSAGALLVPQGECLWLIETSTLAVKSDPTYPQRHFWTGHSWHYDALAAARYVDKYAAEIVREKEQMYPIDKYPICDHMFQCQVAPPQEKCAAESTQDRNGPVGGSEQQRHGAPAGGASVVRSATERLSADDEPYRAWLRDLADQIEQIIRDGSYGNLVTMAERCRAFGTK